VAKKLLAHFGIEVVAYIKEIGGIQSPDPDYSHPDKIRKATRDSLIFCPDAQATAQMIAQLEKAKADGDSLGGIIETVAFHLPVGLGDPVYEKLEANLAKAMLSLPATKGFEIGSGFAAAKMKGSEHNDAFVLNDRGNVTTATNFAGGTLGGISTGLPLIARIAFKPTSSIQKPQQTLSVEKKEKEFKLPEGSRHDPCVTIRAVPIVEAMTNLVIADALLMNRTAKL
jgi:chorismate synthase